MSDNIGEDFKDYHTAQKERRSTRLPVRTAQIMSLQKMGYKVERKTDYQYRINDRIDVFPIHNRYHDIKLNSRDGYKDVVDFITHNRFLK
jgi:hypothetical protein